MCSIALRCSASFWFDSFRSPMMWTSARRRSSARRTWAWSRSICSRSAAGRARPRRCRHPRCRRSRRRTPQLLRSSGRGAGRLELLVLPLEVLELLLERDHFQLAADDDLLELLEVEDLLLQLGLGLLEVPDDLLVGSHVTED